MPAATIATHAIFNARLRQLIHGKLRALEGKHEMEHDRFFDSAEWTDLMAAQAEREQYTCGRCDRVFNLTKPTLTVHYIVPLEKGGTDDPRNTIALCKECSRYVDEHDDLRTRLDIRKSLPDYDKYFDQIDSSVRPWSAWVYGGAKTELPDFAGVDVLSEHLARVAAEALAAMRADRSDAH